MTASASPPVVVRKRRVSKAAVAAHTAAREAGSEIGREAARAAAHAAATAHTPASARHAANYAIKAVTAAGGDDVAEETWQDERVPIPG